MSNLIKYQFVNLDGKDAVLIDNNQSVGEFTPIRKEKKVNIQTISEVETEKALKRIMGEPLGKDGESEAEFQPGLNVTNFDELFEEQKQQASGHAEQIIEQAKEEAEQIRVEAQNAADAAKKRGYEEGREQGYEEGISAARQEIGKREEEIAEMARQQQEELAECIASVEQKYVDVVIALVKKLTGVILEDKDDLILYLIQTAAAELEPSSAYKIRLSADDVYFMENHKAEVMSLMEEGVSLEFLEEKGLEPGQCIIETDHEMVDCSFQTQLDTLIRDLKMLVR